MHAFWIGLGSVVLALGLLDVFLSALNYDESGFLATPLCALQWRLLRSVTRRLARRWRPLALRQVTGLQIMLTIVTWLGSVVAGFGFIYYGLMTGANFEYGGRGVGPSLFGAMYLSAAQLATVGTAQVSPETDWLRVLTIAETMSSLVLVSLILTFLLGVYQVVRDLRTLSANFFSSGATAGDPLAHLARYFPQGEPIGLDGHLQAISDSFWAYADGLHLHHVAYYFQSGRDQFALPYALHMLGGTLAALRWGLPSGHPASVEPVLTRLADQFNQFGGYLQERVSWTSTAVPQRASPDDFRVAWNKGPAPGDLWLGRFIHLNRQMARLAALTEPEDLQDAYRRYGEWLPFAYRAAQLTATISRDLDYQPVLHRAPATDSAIAIPGAAALAVEPARPAWRTLFERWVAVPDPGLIRLGTATVATLAASVTAALLYLYLRSTEIAALQPALFGGVVAMLAVTLPRDASTGERKITTLLSMLPAIAFATLGSAVSVSFGASIAALVVVVLAAVWVGGLGPRAAALGQIAFMLFYFGLVLRFRLALLPAFALAAVVGVLCAWLLRFVLFAERPRRTLSRGLRAFDARLALLLDPLIDVVSAARWDPDDRKRIAADLRQVHRCGAFLQGQLRGAETPGTQPADLRLLLFDTELVANRVVAAAREFGRASAAVPLALRAELAGSLERAQQRLRPGRTGEAGAGEGNEEPPGDWPAVARRLQAAIVEWLQVAGALHRRRAEVLADARLAARELQTGSAAAVPKLRAERSRTQANGRAEGRAGEPTGAPFGARPVESAPMRVALSASARSAIQAAVATGLALVAGAAVTTDHQYWAALAAFLVLGGTETVEETVAKGAQRVAGTIAGVVIGFGVAVFTGADPWAVLPLIVVCVFAAMYLRPVSYALMVFATTAMLALLYEFLGTLTTETLQVRVAETVIGAALALGTAALLLPLRSRQKLNAEAVALLHTVDTVVEACAAGAAGALAGQALTLDRQFRQLMTRATPLRGTWGALRLAGIERRLTAAAALTYHARALIRACEASPAFAPDDTTTQRAAAIHDDIATLIRLLQGDAPEAEPAASPDTGEPQHLARHDVLAALERIDQTVLALTDDLTQASALDPPWRA